MVTIDKHAFAEDPKGGTPVCMICKMGRRHPIHKLGSIKGTATPTKTG